MYDVPSTVDVCEYVGGGEEVHMAVVVRWINNKILVPKSDNDDDE